MLPDRVSNPGPLTYESGALPIALRGPVLCENALLTKMLSMTLRIRAKELLRVWSYDFYDMTLSTE